MGKFTSNRQRELFAALEGVGDLIIAIGPMGISANYEGTFRVTSFDSEDRLVAGDGTFHVHIDWLRVKCVSVDLVAIEGRDEGCLTIWDGEERLFRFYRQAGPFPVEFSEFNGALIST